VDSFVVSGFLQWEHCSNPPPCMKPFDLPLESARRFVAGAGGVSFAVNVGGTCVTCYVTRAALESYFGADADAAPDAADASLRAFDRHVHLIHRVARKLRQREPATAPAAVLTVDAVFRALTRR